MYLGVLEGVRWRLEGKDPHGNPTLGPLAGVTIPTDLAAVRAFMERRTEVNVYDIKVPIVPTGQLGTNVDTYPLFTYDIMAVEPRFGDGYVTSHASDGEELHIERYAQSATDITENGVVVAEDSPRMARTKTAAKPFNFTVEVRAYTRDNTLAAFLLSHLDEVLPARTFLRVPLMDGSVKSWRTERTDSKIVDSKLAEGMGAVGLPAELSHVLTYKVFGFRDNTDTWLMRNLVRTREITITT